MARKRKSKALERDEEQHPPPKKARPTETSLPEGVHHYEALEEVPWDIQRYSSVLVSKKKDLQLTRG